MSEQPINQWNMTTEPSDMMKINTPMPITVAPSPSNQMEVIDDDSAMTVIKLYVANSSLIFTNLRLRLITTRYL